MLTRPLRLTHGDVRPHQWKHVESVGQTAFRFSAVAGALEVCFFFSVFLVQSESGSCLWPSFLPACETTQLL